MPAKKKFQAEKEARPETNPKTVILEKYHDFLGLFSKKDSNTLSSYQKYDYKIILEEEQKYDYTFLYKMSLQKLNGIKRYLNLYLTKGFIQAN